MLPSFKEYFYTKARKVFFTGDCGVTVKLTFDLLERKHHSFLQLNICVKFNYRAGNI